MLQLSNSRTTWIGIFPLRLKNANVKKKREDFQPMRSRRPNRFKAFDGCLQVVNIYRCRKQLESYCMHLNELSSSCRTKRHYGNIMYDRRVVRGNTYAKHIIPTVSVKHSFYCSLCSVGCSCFPLFPTDRQLSQTLQRYEDNRPTGDGPSLENRPGSNLDPTLLKHWRAENTLMYKLVK